MRLPHSSKRILPGSASLVHAPYSSGTADRSAGQAGGAAADVNLLHRLRVLSVSLQKKDASLLESL